MTNATIAKDPVCGMDVEVTSETAKSVYNGQTYYFCDTVCKEKFDNDPEAFLGEPGSEPGSESESESVSESAPTPD